MIGAIAAAGAVKEVAGGLTSALDSYDHAKDANRRATNARAYQAALNGSNAAAYRFLVGRGGGSPQTVPPLAGITDGGYIDGWASAPAREDARNKAKSLAGKYATGVLADPDGRTTVGGIDPTTGQPTSVVPMGLSLGSNPVVVVLLIGIAVALLLHPRGAE